MKPRYTREKRHAQAALTKALVGRLGSTLSPSPESDTALKQAIIAAHSYGALTEETACELIRSYDLAGA